MRISRRREAFRKWMGNIRKGINNIAGTQAFRSLFTLVLIAGLATSSFYWGMSVERGRPKQSPSPVATESREPVVTERSEDMPKSPAKPPAQPAKPAPQPLGPVDKAPAKPSEKTAAGTKTGTASGSTTGTNAAAPTAPKPAAGSSGSIASTASKLLARPVMGETLTSNEWVYSPTFGDWRLHTGLDIKAENGAPVKAAATGTVQSVSHDPSLGVMVVVDHGSGIVATYAGLKDVVVAKGEPVAQNQIIAFVGEPGVLEADMGPHLHFEVKKNGQPENPVALLAR